jgi:hypothetical protein
MVEVKLTGKPLDQRIADRLRNSGGGDADIIVQKGDGPTRTITNVHHSRVSAHGSGGPEKPEGRGLDERGRGR